MYYTYNYKNQKWISSDADIYQPLFTPFSVKQKKAWCSVHKKWEACGKALNGKLFYECGCPIPSQFASVNKPCNRNLPAEIRNIIRKWALERDIGIATTHLRR